MEELKKLDSLTEFQLTNAIEKAASVALASEDDRSEILAKQLAEDNIPKHLDKVATQAFNRRISVVTIGKRGEDTKADDFPLADFNKVASLRGHEEMQKAASVNAPFVFKIEKAEQKKVASYKAPEAPVKQYTPSEVMQKIESFMTKEAAAFQDRMADLMKEEAQLESMVKTASEILSKDTKTGRLLATVYGDTYSKLFAGKVPEEALKKHAAYAILPANFTVQYVEKTIRQADTVDVKRDLLMLKSESLKRIAKESVEIESKLKEAALCKSAAAGYNMLKDIAANAVSVPVNALLAGAKGAVGQTEDILGRSAPFLSPEKGYSPEDVVSLKLLSKDKYQDKRMRLIDMLANPEFAQYPAEEIEKAVEDTIATNQALSSPRMREYLKAEVGARLLAGNRTNRADLAAAADVLKKVVEADKTQKGEAPEAAVAELPEKRIGGAEKALTKVLPSLKDSINKVVGSDLMVKDLGKDWQAVQQQIKSDRELKEDLQEKERQERFKAVEGYIKAYNKAVQAQMKGPRAASILNAYRKSIGKPKVKAKKIQKYPVQQLEAAKQYLNNLSPQQRATLMQAVGGA